MNGSISFWLTCRSSVHVSKEVVTIHVKSHPADLIEKSRIYKVHRSHISTSKFLTEELEKLPKPASISKYTPLPDSVIVVIWNVDVDIYFSMWFQWAYHKTLKMPREIRASENKEPTPKITLLDRASEEYLALIHCLLLAHRLNDMTFKNIVTSAILQRLRSSASEAHTEVYIKWLLNTQIIKELYDITDHGSPTRKLLTDTVAQYANEMDILEFGEGDRKTGYAFPGAFARELLVPLMRLRHPGHKLEGRDERYYERLYGKIE